MSHSTSRGCLISTVITSAIHHHADIDVPSRRSVEHMSVVIHVGTREHIIGVVLWLKPEGRDGDDRSLLTLTQTMCNRERRTWGCTRAVPGPLA